MREWGSCGSIRRARTVLVPLVTTTVVAACGDHEFEPPDRAARVQRAESTYAPAMFDTVSWDDESAALTTGNVVYAEECRRCHGPLGMGGTDYGRERELDVPSLVTPEWTLAEPDSLRRRIYVGHESGMPIYGDGELSVREIDAAAAYILRSLRPDVLEEQN